MTTFAPAFAEMVPWMSGLVYGLQNRLRRFESARHLAKKRLKDFLQPFLFTGISLTSHFMTFLSEKRTLSRGWYFSS